MKGDGVDRMKKLVLQGKGLPVVSNECWQQFWRIFVSLNFETLREKESALSQRSRKPSQMTTQSCSIAYKTTGEGLSFGPYRNLC